jgi:hypothetical protein
VVVDDDDDDGGCSFPGENCDKMVVTLVNPDAHPQTQTHDDAALFWSCSLAETTLEIMRCW